MGAILRVTSLSKVFGAKHVLQSISIDVNEGDIYGIIGPTGVGKTTLLECIIGFLRPEEGDVYIKYNNNYYSVLKHAEHFKPLFGFASQYPSFYNNLTVNENLTYFGTLYGLSNENIKQNIEHLLSLVNLQNDKNTLAGNLSGGMQKRLEIASALIHNPSILLLDEPTADLDVISRKQIWQLIRDINKKGTTIVLSSHFLQEMELLCSKVAILKAGRIVANGTIEQLKKRYGSKNLDQVFELVAKPY